MRNPAKYLIRRIALRKYSSGATRGLLPLDRIGSAAVFVDSSAEDAERACDDARRFFGGMGIPVTVLCPGKEELNYAGYMRRRFREPEGRPRSEELFITLADSPECFASEFEARCSPASFKVGRYQLSGDVFDLVVTSPEGVPAGQAAVFGAVKDYLSKIK